MSSKNGGQKRDRRYPTACVGSYFIPDENIQTYLICLQSCNIQISGLLSMSVYNNEG